MAAQTPWLDEEDEERWARWANPAEKKGSDIASRTASGSSKGAIYNRQDIALAEHEFPRFLSL
jgi:hypothetical protein